jgi:hypothetical protein
MNQEMVNQNINFNFPNDGRFWYHKNILI